MIITPAHHQLPWDTFLSQQPFKPFMQSWTMGEVYRDNNQPPLRLEAQVDSKIVGICQAILVPARRGRHLAIPYGPVVDPKYPAAYPALLQALTKIAKEEACTFIRLSPFLTTKQFSILNSQCHPELDEGAILNSPLHLLAEHIWYLPLTEGDPWQSPISNRQSAIANPTCHPELDEGPIDKDTLFISLRKTTRNLIRRATKEGVTITKSTDPLADLDKFIALHEETRRRHHFTPYTNQFFRSQLEHFSNRQECTLYLAHYQNEVIASSIHMHWAGETSYHHGASTHKYPKIPASYLLQWTAINDALERGDHVYSFWGIAPVEFDDKGKARLLNKQHPFAGVTTFKTGYGGKLLNLMPCQDIPISKKYYLTRAFETLRKWKRGF